MKNLLLTQTDHCEVCTLPLYLYPVASPGLCQDCSDKLVIERELQEFPCGCCGRKHYFQFDCNSCYVDICDGCENTEHILNDCRGSDDDDDFDGSDFDED